MAELEFEKMKKIVRSVLIPCQKGCTLRDFHRSFRELNGINLPYGKLGFKSDLLMLEHMSDAVIIQYSRTGEVILSAKADESTQHIQKMVSKQKPPKKKVPLSAPMYGRSYAIPPRFISKSVTPKPVIPKPATPKPLAQGAMPSLNGAVSKKVAPLGLQNKIKKLVSRFPSGLSLSEFLTFFERVNGEKLMFRSIGFFTLEECLETVPNVYMKTVENEIFVFPKTTNENPQRKQFPSSSNGISDDISYSQGEQSNPQEKSFEKISECRNTQAEASGGSEISSNHVSHTNSSEYEDPEDIPPFVLKSLQKLANMYPDGIKATEFPSVYENVINTEFDLHSLGYNDLSVFINAVPNIFKRVNILGVKKNWLIVPAGKNISEPPNSKALLHDTIISNIRTLLEANPEGIRIEEFLHIYSINCLEPLCINEFGFTSLESFLMNNANQVPLMIASGPYGKILHLVQAPELRNPEPQLNLRSEPPTDVLLPGTDILCVKLPEETDLASFFPVLVQTVENPSTFYIQLEKYSKDLKKLYQRIEAFYQSSASDLYIMKTMHVKVNTVCMAIWPRDKLWYRVIITSILSLEEVQVFYFDYGTKYTIPVSLLRYMKKEFSTLPAQALLSNLACLKPAGNSDFWSQEASDTMLSLCSNVTLMAQIHSVSDSGILSLVLCNTNGSEDVFINDELLNAGLAEAQLEKLVESEIAQEPLNLENPLAVGFQALSLNNSPYIPPPSPIPAPIPSYQLPSTSNHLPVFKATTSSSSDSEVFDDDDDIFEKFYEEVQNSVMKRYIKRVRTADAYTFHIICVDGDPFVSCGDICALIWDKRDVNYLRQRLQNRQCNLPSLKTLEGKPNEDMFYQIDKFHVKGCQKINENMSQILVCPLSNVIEILNLLGQPSDELRRLIKYELENFNSSDPAWMELCEGQIPDMEQVVLSTEEDKLNRLCLYDLIAMKESIRLRAERIQNNPARGGTGMDEIVKMEQLLSRVNKRIKHVKGICRL